VRPATVRTKLHRARLRLRKMLEREGYEDGYAYE
jgi:DNA-directed RNA polymerase specialized sigma24 family protein